MSSDLWKAFHADDVSAAELTTLLHRSFAGGRTVPGSEDVELTNVAGSGGEAALVLHYHDGVLVDIAPGPELTEDDVTRIREKVESALLTDAGIRVCRRIIFSMPESVGWWRYRDMFQLLPAPPEAARPGVVLGDHPLILEVAYQASDDGIIRLVRERRITWEIALLLNLILRGRVNEMDSLARHIWVVGKEEPHLPEWVNGGYWIPGMVFLAEGFGDSAGPTLVEVADDAYYGRRGISVDEKLDIPSSTAELLDRYFALPREKKDHLLRAAYWLRHAQQVWGLSHSAYYLAVVTAIEVLLESKAEQCPHCKKMTLGKGPTAAFKDFLEEHAPIGEDEPSREFLYQARGKLAHGRALFRSDFPDAWGTLDPAEWEERERSDAATRVARRAILNWLRATTTS